MAVMNERRTLALLGHWDADKRLLSVAFTAQGGPVTDGYCESPAGDSMVEVVPASQLQGAVDRAREVVEAWDEWQADTAFEDPFERLKRAVTEMRVHLGGQ